MNRQIKSTQGFTLAELLIVVAIVMVLAAIAIPVFTGSLEKSKESTDVANVRSACSLVTNAAMLGGQANETVKIDGNGTYYTLVPLVQGQEGWQTESLLNNSQSESGQAHWVGTPKPDGSAKVTCDSDFNVIVYWNAGGFPGAVVTDSAKDYKPALNAVLSTLYDELVADRLTSSNNHISWVLIKSGKIAEVHNYKTESDKGGQATVSLTKEELDNLNSQVSKALEGTGYKLSTNSTARVFFDWEGNVVTNDRANGAPAIGGQGANATVVFMPENGNKNQTVTNDTDGWRL